MHLRLRRSAALLLGAAAVLALPGCKESSTPRGTAGRMAFSYEGAHTGTFSAQGVFSPLGGRSFAVGLRFEDAGAVEVSVLGVSPRGITHQDIVFLDIADPAVGTVTCADPFDCSFGAFLILNARVDSEEVEAFYEMVSGTVRVTQLTSTRIRGEFELVMEEAFVFEPGADRIAVRAGTFDVPIRSGAGLGF